MSRYKGIKNIRTKILFYNFLNEVKCYFCYILVEPKNITTFVFSNT